MSYVITRDTPVTEDVLKNIAFLPTKSLPQLVEDGFFKKLGDADFMRIAALLAQKGYDEGGCPIGGIIIDNETRQIIGKGHNTLVQGNDPYNHGETSAIRDAGRHDFSLTTLFTTLSPCDVCATLVYMRQFNRLVVGDVTNASGNEQLLRDKGVAVDILEDEKGVALYARYRKEKPAQDLEDWKGLAAVKTMISVNEKFDKSARNKQLTADKLESFIESISLLNRMKQSLSDKLRLPGIDLNQYLATDVGLRGSYVCPGSFSTFEEDTLTVGTLWLATVSTNPQNRTLLVTDKRFGWPKTIKDWLLFVPYHIFPYALPDSKNWKPKLVREEAVFSYDDADAALEKVKDIVAECFVRPSP